MSKERLQKKWNDKQLSDTTTQNYTKQHNTKQHRRVSFSRRRWERWHHSSSTARSLNWEWNETSEEICSRSNVLYIFSHMKSRILHGLLFKITINIVYSCCCTLTIYWGNHVHLNINYEPDEAFSHSTDHKQSYISSLGFFGELFQLIWDVKSPRDFEQCNITKFYIMKKIWIYNRATAQQVQYSSLMLARQLKHCGKTS